MSRTEIDGDKILDGSIQKKDIDTATVGQSVITSIEGIDGLEIVSFTGADTGTGHVVLRSAGGFGTEYYAFQDISESTTIADGWVQKSLFTTPTIVAGKYIIHYKAQVTNTSKKNVGFQINISVNGGAFIDIDTQDKAPTTADVYETRSGFEEITLATDNPLQIQVNFGQTIAGGTGKIQKVAVYLFKVGEI